MRVLLMLIGYSPAQRRGEGVPTFSHFLDLPILLLIVMLGSQKPDTWQLFFFGSALAITIALLLTLLIPRLYPWELRDEPAGN